MISSPYHKKKVEEWGKITASLIKKHPLNPAEIVNIVLKSWSDIFNSKIGSFNIGKHIHPSPQIMSFLLHELVAHYISLKYKGQYRIGAIKTEKDIHCIKDADFSVEIKASSHANQIFANRSYAQPESGKGQKNKNGYYITINFEKFSKTNNKPEILLIRFGYLDHKDWIAQKAQTGQQARLSGDVYLHKLKVIYKAPKIKSATGL